MINQGSIFEGFRLLRPLGRGWLGEVHAAQDLDAGTTVALRVLAPEHLAQPQLLAQFLRLNEKVRRLKHPGILEWNRVAEHENRAYYTMTLAQSGSVRQLLQSAARDGQYLDLLVTVDLVRQAAAALEFAHQADLLHGNLKPENLLLQGARVLVGRTAYTVQLSDFGVGELRAYTYGTHDRLIITTPAYMSPEQCRGVRNDARSDIYALGVILYELLTGLVPFETRDLADALEKHQHVAPIPPGQVRLDIPEDLEEVVLTCLAKSPEYRYQSAGQLDAALQGVLNRLMPSGPNPTVVLPELAQPAPPAFEAPRDRASEPRLLILDQGGNVMRAEPLSEQTTTIGRSAKNSVILDHAGVSRHHLNLELEGDKVFVTDLSSTNGSVLDRIRLPAMKRVPWAYGSVLHVEPFWLALVAPHKAAPQARIGVTTESTALTLIPGVPQALRVSLANTGRTVDHLMVSVNGAPAEWVQNAFHEVQLNPGTRGETLLQLLVPKDSRYHAGEYAVQVVARSRENPDEMGVAPLTWTVAAFTNTTLEVSPERRSAWFRTRYELRLNNDGNTPIAYQPQVNDDEGAVKLESPRNLMRVPQDGNLSRALPWRTVLAVWSQQLREGVGKVRVAPLPQQFIVAPGEQYRLPIKVRLPVRWVGTTRARTLRVNVLSDLDKPPPVVVRLQQNPVVPLWWIPVLLAAGALSFFYLNQPPAIVDVNVEPKNPRVGQPFTVTWETKNARRVKLQPLDRELPVGAGGQGRFTFTSGVTAPTELKVTAYSRFKSSQRALTIEPQLPPPNIVQFEVTPVALAAGKTVTVRWDVANVKNVTLEPFGTVDAKGEIKRQVTADTAFRLKAGAGDDAIMRNVDVKVLAPVIELFKVTPQNAEPGQTVTLRWKVANASTITIDPIGTVASSGQTQITAEQNATYRITAGNGQTSVSSAGTVRVAAKPPRVLAFTVTPAKVRPGGNYTLSWETQDASSVEFRGPLGVQALPPSGSVAQVAPNAAAPLTFTLVAKNVQGQEDARSAGLVVLPPVVKKIQVAEKPTPVKKDKAKGDTTKKKKDAVDSKPATTKATPRPRVEAKPKPAESQPVVVKPPLPNIKVFSVSDHDVTRGDSVTLKWHVTGAEQVILKPLNKPFPAQGQLTVPLTKTTTYTLSAAGGKVSAKQSVKVNAPVVVAEPKTTTPVDAQPKVVPADPARVVTFQVSEKSVLAGDRVTFTWDVENAVHVTISGFGEVEAKGSRETAISESMSYVLRAENRDGKAVSRSLRVSAKPPPTVPDNRDLPGSAALNGTWNHSFGKLTLQVAGRNVTGTFTNERTGEQGEISGKLDRSTTAPFSLNARVALPGKPDENISFVASFNEKLTGFHGPYSSRAARERWCGWRPGAVPPAECHAN